MNRIVAVVWLLITVGSAASGGAQEPDGTTVEFLNSDQAGTTNLPFSEAVRVGDMLFLSGQVGVNTFTDELVPGGIAKEARKTMDNIKTSLQVHGYSMADVVKCTVMLADIGEWQAFNQRGALSGPVDLRLTQESKLNVSL